MGRPKKPTLELRTLADCDQALGDIAVAEAELAAVTAERDLAVAAASAKFEGALNREKTKAAGLRAALGAYYYANVTELEKDGQKHVQLVRGRFGRRDNPPALKPLNRSWTWPAIANAVRAWAGPKWKDYFRVPEPVLDRDALKKARLAVEELKQLGVKVETDETFYVEPAALPKPAEVAG